jgi:hypothetical protein
VDEDNVTESEVLGWFEELEKRAQELRVSRTGEHDVWAAVFAELHTALESVFPPSHAVLRRWDEARKRALQVILGNNVETPEIWVKGELLGIFQAAGKILRDGRLRTLADGVRAETVSQCLDQGELLARSRHAAAAMVLAGGGLETHLRTLCIRFGLTWQGDGSIAKYKQALDQGRKQGTQSIVSSSDSSLIESWGKDRNEAAHTPTTFSKTPADVLHSIEGMRNFLARAQ